MENIKILKTDKLSAIERQIVTLFCINYGTHLSCRTNSLLRPLEIKDLEAAFAEREAAINRDVSSYQKAFENFKNHGQLSTGLQQYFGAKCPPIKEVKQYFNAIIEQTKAHDIRKNYRICVDLLFKTDEILTFHKSLNPKVTFGYSSELHEQCFCELSTDIKKSISPCIVLDENALYSDYHSCGVFRAGDDVSNVAYEDLRVYLGDRIILSTISHENMYDLFFDQTDLTHFSKFEGCEARNKQIINKLLT